MTCKCHPDSPFLWYNNPRDSIFMKDHTFKPKSADGKTLGQLVTANLDKRRATGENVGTLVGITNKKREEEILSYRLFGVYSRAKSSTKPQQNKHEK
jgi:hypothetical protein